MLDLASKQKQVATITIESIHWNYPKAEFPAFYSTLVQEPSSPTFQYWTSLLTSTYQPLEP